VKRVCHLLHGPYLVDPRVRREAEALVDAGYAVDVICLSEKHSWYALPGEVNDWWRIRNRLSLVLREGAWQTEGEGSDRATVTYARLVDGQLVYSDSQHNVIEGREPGKH